MTECVNTHKSLLYRELKTVNPDDPIVAMTAGSFDLVHPGYTYTFEEARRHCDKFIIFLQEDPSATRYTKYKPIIPYYERYKTLLAMQHVDEVYMYQTEDELLDLMRFFKPDVRILGEDYINKPFTGDDLSPRVVYTTRSHEWSTTKIKNRICAMTLAQNEKLLDLFTSQPKLLEEIRQGDFSSIE